jgi:hypothetical protein
MWLPCVVDLSDVTTYFQHYYATNINVTSVCNDNVVVYSVQPTTEAHSDVYAGSSILYADMSLAIGERIEIEDVE